MTMTKHPADNDEQQQQIAELERQLTALKQHHAKGNPNSPSLSISAPLRLADPAPHPPLSTAEYETTWVSH